MTYEQKNGVILAAMLLSAMIIIVSFWMYISAPMKHSEGVITLNDDCKITVIGEE